MGGGGRQHRSGRLCEAYEDPEFVAAATQIAGVTDREVLSLLDKTPYSP